MIVVIDCSRNKPIIVIHEEVKEEKTANPSCKEIYQKRTRNDSLKEDVNCTGRSSFRHVVSECLRVKTHRESELTQPL